MNIKAWWLRLTHKRTLSNVCACDYCGQPVMWVTELHLLGEGRMIEVPVLRQFDGMQPHTCDMVRT